MCGLCGIFAYQSSASPVDRSELIAVREAMRSRGPDGAGEWMSADGKLALAHRRLAIIDLSNGGAQPMLDPETGNALVFNGEIYNYQELRAELERRGSVFSSHSDSEVLLKLFAKYGVNMLGKLRGMFAFAIWDAQARRLVLARDPLGIKPLYISDDGRALRFASQVKALVAGGAIDRTPSAAGSTGFLLWGHIPEPFTLYKKVRALRAGHYLTVASDGRREERPYFDLNEELHGLHSDLTVASEGERQLQDAIGQSIRSHLVSDVPVGLFLSSGLDSVTIASHIAATRTGGFLALTLGFREFQNTENDETPLAAKVAAQFGAQHEVRWISRADFAGELNHLIECMDQPSVDGVNSFFVSRAAREAGLKVVLSGLGGDELFGGYSAFRSIPRLVRSTSSIARIPRLGSALRRVLGPLLPRRVSPKYAGLIEYGGDWGGAYLLRRGLFMPWELPPLLGRDVAREGLAELDTITELRRTVAGLPDDRRRVMAMETAWYMRNQLLRDADWASMAHSVEVRVPFVDLFLLRAVVGLMTAGAPPGKADMAATMPLAAPEEVLHRPKTGFSVPVRQWLLADSCKTNSDDSEDMGGLRSWALFLYKRFTGEAAA
jgi:asparagine synthase (glutamine-hydrolysing)